MNMYCTWWLFGTCNIKYLLLYITTFLTNIHNLKLLSCNSNWYPSIATFNPLSQWFSGTEIEALYCITEFKIRSGKYMDKWPSTRQMFGHLQLLWSFHMKLVYKRSVVRKGPNTGQFGLEMANGWLLCWTLYYIAYSVLCHDMMHALVSITIQWYIYVLGVVAIIAILTGSLFFNSSRS